MKGRAVFGVLVAGAFSAGCVSTTPLESESKQCRWVGSWGASQQLVEPRNELPVERVADLTIRQTVHPTLKGSRVRVRISNEFGDGPLVIGGARLADARRAGEADIAPHTNTPLSFSGASSVTVPQGAAYYSDPVEFKVTPFDDIAVTLYVVSAPDPQSGHPGSRTTTHYSPGNQLDAASLPGAATMDRWYYMAGLDVLADRPSVSVGVIGDSITDGRGSTTNQNDRWTDFLAKRLQADPKTGHVSVINLGLGGNRVISNGLGPNVLARLDRDVLAQPNMRHVIVFEGINDIGGLARDENANDADGRALLARLKSAFEQVVARAHAKGIKVYGATIAPFKGSGFYPFRPVAETVRQDLNDWIRTSGTFDAVFDFDKVLRDPEDPTQLYAPYDIGDHLHPSPAGFEAIAKSVPLALFSGPVKGCR